MENSSALCRVFAKDLGNLADIFLITDSKNIPTAEGYRGNVTCQGPRACYDESKRIGETLCYVYNTKFGVETNTIRPFNVFGPGMLETDYRVLPNFAVRIKQGLPLNVYGTGSQTRTFCYISDAIEGYIRILLSDYNGESFNIGAEFPEISMLDLSLIHI